MCKLSVKKRLKVYVLILTMLFLTACDAGNVPLFGALADNETDDDLLQAAEIAINTTFISMENEAVLSYDVPLSSPHILADGLGYETEKNKLVFFYGAELPDTYVIKNAETDDIVFEGAIIERGYSDKYNAFIGYGDFTELADEGRYYAEASLLGRSYDFGIGGDLYTGIFNEACRTYYYNRCGITLTEEYAGANAHNACHTQEAVLREDITTHVDVSGGWHQDGSGSKDTVHAAEALSNMLLSYEIFPEAFKDDTGIPESGNGIPDILDEIRYEADFIMKLQSVNTGAVYSRITVSEASYGAEQIIYVEESSIEAAYAFAFVMSKFSYIYQSFDKEYATTCLKAADRAWRYAVLNEDKQDSSSSWKLAAAAEIYRASGLGECRNYLNEYFESSEYTGEIDRIRLYACITYLNTKQPVNTDYCEAVIKVIMKKAEDISAESRSAEFMVPGNKEQSNNSELLEKMITMTLVDHVITNHEYDSIIENYLHYFLGRNALSVSYIDNTGQRNYRELNESLGIMKQFDADSMLIFMLSRIVSNDGFKTV